MIGSLHESMTLARPTGTTVELTLITREIDFLRCPLAVPWAYVPYRSSSWNQLSAIQSEKYSNCNNGRLNTIKSTPFSGPTREREIQGTLTSVVSKMVIQEDLYTASQSYHVISMFFSRVYK